MGENSFYLLWRVLLLLFRSYVVEHVVYFVGSSCCDHVRVHANLPRTPELESGHDHTRRLRRIYPLHFIDNRKRGSRCFDLGAPFEERVLFDKAVGNLETMAFGREYSTGLFPEVISCLLLSTLVSGFAIHRVCATVCLLFSIGHIYVMNRLSASKYGPAPGSAQLVATKPKRKN